MKNISTQNYDYENNYYVNFKTDKSPDLFFFEKTNS
jgi:hypothetical protein